MNQVAFAYQELLVSLRRKIQTQLKYSFIHSLNTHCFRHSFSQYLLSTDFGPSLVLVWVSPGTPRNEGSRARGLIQRVLSSEQPPQLLWPHPAAQETAQCTCLSYPTQRARDLVSYDFYTPIQSLVEACSRGVVLNPWSFWLAMHAWAKQVPVTGKSPQKDSGANGQKWSPSAIKW